MSMGLPIPTAFYVFVTTVCKEEVMPSDVPCLCNGNAISCDSDDEVVVHIHQNWFIQ